jgi:hypothetical protein
MDARVAPKQRRSRDSAARSVRAAGELPLPGVAPDPKVSAGAAICLSMQPKRQKRRLRRYVLSGMPSIEESLSES